MKKRNLNSKTKLYKYKLKKINSKIKREKRKNILINYGRILEATNFLDYNIYFICGILLDLKNINEIKLEANFISEGDILNLKIQNDISYKNLNYLEKIQRAKILIKKGSIFEYLDLLKINLNIITGYLIRSNKLNQKEKDLLYEKGYIYLKKRNYKIN